MAYRLTQEELDQQFEQFLKESVSDDSVDLGSSSKRPSVLDNLGKAPQQQREKESHRSVPWWQEDEDSDETPGKDLLPSKPIPKPRSKILNKVRHQGRSSCSQRSFEQIASETKAQSSKMSSDSKARSASDDSVTQSSNTKPDMAEDSPISSETASDNPPTEDKYSGATNSSNALGKTFRKSLRKSQTIQEVEEDQPKSRCLHDEPKVEAVVFSRDSLEPDDSMMIYGSAQSSSALGLQTLNEEDEERVRFLDSLDKRATEDSRLIKDQESFSPHLVSPQRDEEVSLTKQNQSLDEERGSGSVKGTAASPAYSDDFEDETSDKEPDGKKPGRGGMLAKVSLHDSLNSTDGAPLPGSHADKTDCPGIAQEEGLDPTGLSNVQSGATDMETLQEAYRQITHSLGECEEREEHCWSAASFCTPEFLKRTTQHASTTESDLPTAEELMRAIRPESGIGFGSGLAALSEAAVEKEAERLDSEGHTTRAKTKPSCLSLSEVDNAALEPYQTFSLHRLSSITEEAKKLVQEQDDISKVSHVPSVTRGKKTQGPGRSTTTARLSPSPGKASVPPFRNKIADIKTVPKAVTTNRNSKLAKPPSLPSHGKGQKQTSIRISSLGQTHVVKGPDSALQLSSELIASMQSIVSLLQHRMTEDGSPDKSDSNTQQAKQSKEDEEVGAAARGHDPQLDYASLERIHHQLAQKKGEFLFREKQLLQQHSDEISALKQENYMLLIKLRSAEEANKKQKWSFGEASDAERDDKLRLMEKEMKEQETLIQGYHLENEKLYLQMKTLGAQSKQNEEAMFAENQRLLSELAITKEQLQKSSKHKTVGHFGSDAHGYSVAELLAELQAAQRKESQLQEENRRLKQERQALQVDLQIMKKECNLAKAQVISTSGDKRFEFKLLEEKHKEEVAALKKRLQWYAENQELLDKDAARLRAANAETQRLTAHVERLKMEVAKQTNQQQRKVKERATEAKRIQDLERQVKEMEEILRRRHPNSLPVLMLAAAAASGEKEVEGHPCAAPHPSYSTTLLERRIHRLEAELEDRDEEAKRSIRAMEQHFHRIKLQYEQQISDLEQRLAEQNPGCHKCSLKKSETQFNAVQELEQLKELHQIEVSTLKAEVAALKEQLLHFHSSTEPDKPSRHQKQAEAAHVARLERMNQELTSKSRSIQELKRTVERLQRERKTMLFSPKAQTSSSTSKQAGKDPSSLSLLAETFPPTQDEKDYQPGIFSGSHISEAQHENERLRIMQQQLEQQWLEEKVSLQTTVTQAHAELQRVQEQHLQQLALLKAEHQREMERLVAGHALEHSTSKVAELKNQVKSQGVMVVHLREQLKELQRTKEALALSKLREETLQSQLTKLLEELKEAKAAHSPGLRHFASLEHKIHTMELRYNQREQELLQMIAQTRAVVEQEQQKEVTHWKRLAQGKSGELEAFRQELDSILDVLRELQKQGVVIPATRYSSAAGCVFRSLRS